MAEKRIKVTGTYYTETERGRGYAEDFSEIITLDTELTEGLLRSYVQKKVIDAHLIKKLGRDKYRGWQTCAVEELPFVNETPKSTGKRASSPDLGVV